MLSQCIRSQPVSTSTKGNMVAHEEKIVHNLCVSGDGCVGNSKHFDRKVSSVSYSVTRGETRGLLNFKSPVVNSRFSNLQDFKSGVFWLHDLIYSEKYG